jgi:hypothetical protein
MDQKNILHLKARIASCEMMLNHCTDAIQQLSGFTPDEFTFTFSIKGRPIVTMPIEESESRFCIGVFMQWHKFYSQEIRNAYRELETVPHL